MYSTQIRFAKFHSHSRASINQPPPSHASTYTTMCIIITIRHGRMLCLYIYLFEMLMIDESNGMERSGLEREVKWNGTELGWGRGWEPVDGYTINRIILVYGSIGRWVVVSNVVSQWDGVGTVVGQFLFVPFSCGWLTQRKRKYKTRTKIFRTRQESQFDPTQHRTSQPTIKWMEHAVEKRANIVR